MNSPIERFVPLTGVAFAVLLIVGVLLGGDTPALDASASEVVDFFTDNATILRVSSVVLAVAMFALLLFVGCLASAIRDQGSHLALTSVLSGGGVIAAAGIGVDSALRFVLVESAGEVSPEAVQALFALWSGFFLAIHVGFAIFILAASLVALSAKSSPIWLAGLGVLASLLLIVPIVAVTLIGLVLAGLWIIATSVLLYRQPLA
jgi:hypothetical protein